MTFRTMLIANAVIVVFTGTALATTSASAPIDTQGNSGWSDVASDSDRGVLSPLPEEQTAELVEMTPSASSALAGTAALDTVVNPAKTLTSAPVQSSDGKPVGKVEKVDMGADGTAQALDIKIGGLFGLGGKTVSVAANRLSYDVNKRIVVAELTENQIKALPAHKTTGSQQVQRRRDVLAFPQQD